MPFLSRTFFLLVVLPYSSFGLAPYVQSPLRYCRVIKLTAHLDRLAPLDDLSLKNVRKSLSSFPALGVTAVVALIYPQLKDVAEFLHPLVATTGKAAETGEIFFNVLSLVFGTLVAATVSDTSGNISNLRNAVLEEVTLTVILATKLNALVNCNRGDNLGAAQDLMKNVILHTDTLITQDTLLLLDTSTREYELGLISEGADPLFRSLEIAVAAQSVRGNKEGEVVSLPDLGFAVSDIENIIKVRASRLSLENANTPEIQLLTLQLLSFTISVAYIYQQSFLLNDGDRLLTSILCGAVQFLCNLVADLNDPYSGQYTIEYRTARAELRYLQTMSDSCKI